MFAAIESDIRDTYGAESSGFQLIDSNEDGLRWRLALIDSASHSIDVQYYVWYGDAAGRILLKRLRDAAESGARQAGEARVTTDFVTRARTALISGAPA